MILAVSARFVQASSPRPIARPPWNYATALYEDDAATLDDQREAVATLADAERIARRVLGGAHPFMMSIEHGLQQSREVLRAREGGDVSALRAALDAMKAT